MPRSTSKTDRPHRRPLQPPPAEPEVGGPVVPVPEMAASGPGGDGETARRPGGQPARAKRRPAQKRSAPPRLIDTAGPDPATPPERVRLTIGSVLAPHGVRGEFRIHVQTDDPEHLLTLKRVYLGDETSPRTVLGVRMHAGHALMRLQGISSPETVERFRGLPLRIHGADARPLAANEYFLYQVIGLEVFDEAGNRLGRVTDLMETGANDVLVVAPDEGEPLLLPSHPDVVIDMDPAAGKIVVRPLEYYGE